MTSGQPIPHPTDEQALEDAWIAEQVAAMPKPSRREIETWAALLDIKALVRRETARQMGRAS